MSDWAKQEKVGYLDSIFRLKKISDDSQLITPLRRCLTTLELTLLGIGATLGMTNFVIIGNVTKHVAGSGTFLSFLIAGFIALLSAACFAEFAAQIPKAGSAYTYAYVVAGELFAFIAGWNIILEYLLGLSSIGIAFSASLDNIVNNTISRWANQSLADLNGGAILAARPDFIAFTVVLLAGILVCAGATPTVISMCILTTINLCLTAFTTILGFYFANASNFAEQHTGGIFPFGVNGVFAGAATCFYAYNGLDAITVAAEEAIHPARSVPFAIFSATAASTVLYFIMSMVLAFLVPYYAIHVESAFSLAFKENGILWAGYLVASSSLISTSASLLVTSYTLPRIVYAMASDGLFFEIFANVSRKRQVPGTAVAACAIFAAVTAMFFNLEFLTQFLALGILTSYIIVAISLLLHRYSPIDILYHKPEEKDKENEMAGHLKPRFVNLPLLRTCRPGVVVTIAVFCLLVFSTGFWLLIRYGESQLGKGHWWAWMLFVILLSAVIGSVGTMYLYECRKIDHATFKVPFVPFLPSLSIILNLFLITKLTPVNYLRFVIWMAIGLLIYFLYGIKHSKEKKANQHHYEFLEDFPSDSDQTDLLVSTTVRCPQPKPTVSYGTTAQLTHRDVTNND